jgi:protein-disulfide isomerase
MTSPAQSRLIKPVTESDHIRGPATALVTLVEYGDYQCPFCGRAHPIIEALREAMGERLRFVFRNFPLTQIHPHAQRAAEAAEAAGAPGKFWEMHDIVYENQHALDDASLLEYAKTVGLDTKAFIAALSSGEFIPKIREDFLSGVRSGVNGTPTFFIENVRYDGPHDFEPMLAALENFAEVKEQG